MDPAEESSPAQSSPARAALPPPAMIASSLPGPKVFVLSPLPGNVYDVDHYFYARSADVTTVNYAALLAFGVHYGHPVTIHGCPDLAVFQVRHPTAVVCPFEEVPAPVIRRGHKLLGTASSASASGNEHAVSSFWSLRLELWLPGALNLLR